MCVNCTGGFFSASAGSSLCNQCSLARSSSPGFSECNLADLNYFLDPNAPLTTAVSQLQSLPCPKTGCCLGGYYTPQPLVNHWVSHLSLSFADNIFPCTRATCRDASPADPLACWTRGAAFTSAQCADPTFTCAVGAAGPLCGSCAPSYDYSSSSLTCIPCEGANTASYTVLLVLLAGAALSAALRAGRIVMPPWVLKSWPVGALRQVETGMLKVLWATFQIISSISWTVGVVFPPAFQYFLRAISLFSVDFLSPKCIGAGGDFYSTVYVWSLTPIALSALVGCSYIIWLGKMTSERSSRLSTENALLKLRKNHTYRFILLSYCVLPAVSLKLF
jgi:hypothetical protein